MLVDELNLIMDNTWGEGEDCVDALLMFFNNNTELIADILRNDRSFNRYSCVYSWTDLAAEIAYDEMFQTEEYENDEGMIFLREHCDEEEVVKEYLIKQNWAIDTNTGFAIGFDDDIHVINHEV